MVSIRKVFKCLFWRLIKPSISVYNIEETNSSITDVISLSISKSITKYFRKYVRGYFPRIKRDFITDFITGLTIPWDKLINRISFKQQSFEKTENFFPVYNLTNSNI